MQKEDTIDIGSRLELFVDDWLIEKMRGADLRLHHPVPREVAITFDREWEGNGSAYVTLFQDGEIFRMYYRGSSFDMVTKKGHHQWVCYAESRDGIEWIKPELGLFEFNGSKQNSIMWKGVGKHNFTPFKDTNPACKPEAQYKALASRYPEEPGGDERSKLVAFQSPDGIHWRLMREEPVITKGVFDSQNVAFWDSVRNRYVDFHRGFKEDIRHIMTCTSEDFLNWTDPQFVDFGEAPREQLYTNATVAYHRAPHILLAFPKRFVPERKKIPDHPFPGVSDGVFMSSRDGLHWRLWHDAFIRPGLQRARWWQRNNMTAWGILTTKPAIPGLPDELSLYSSEGYCSERNCLRRYSLRMDGFVSVCAPYAGGEFTTRPLLFDGKQLVLNYSTSAAGSVQVEITDAQGKPVPGFELADSAELYGDEIEAAVSWKDGSDVSRLAGRPIRLRFVLKDADLYSVTFRP